MNVGVKYDDRGFNELLSVLGTRLPPEYGRLVHWGAGGAK